MEVGTGYSREPVQHLSAESKPAWRTSEFWVFVVLALGLLIAGLATGSGDGTDDLGAGRVWLYVTILGSAYLVSRGLAKAGTTAPRWEDPIGSGAGIGERVKAAAEVLRDGQTTAAPSSEAPTRTQF